MATNQTSAASPSTQNQYVMTWYACGQALPPGTFDGLQTSVLDHVKKTMPNLIPTTYEAAEAYLHEELKKPKGERDLRREMCMMIPIGLPKDRKVCLVVPAMKLILPMHSGSMMVFPTIDFPPDSFGSPEQMGFLDSKNTGGDDHNIMLVYDPPTSIPQKGIILFSYLTKSGPDEPVDSSVKCIQWDKTAYD